MFKIKITYPNGRIVYMRPFMQSGYESYRAAHKVAITLAAVLLWEIVSSVTKEE